MKTMSTFVLATIIAITSAGLQQATAQANKQLSNLTATSVNQSLVPNSDSVKNLGSAAKNWGIGYLYQLKLRKNSAGNGNVLDANGIELGYGVSGKEINAGKIGYAVFTPNTLDIVGAGSSFSTRAIKFWAEGGAVFTGKVGIGINTPAALLHVTSQTELISIYGVTNGAQATGILGEANNGSLAYGVWGKSTSGYAGFFNGNLGYTGNFVKVSDQRLKENIRPLDKVLDKIMLLKPSQYNFKKEYGKMNLSQGEQVGFIAQEMEKVFPQLVKTIADKQVNDTKISEYKGVDYVALVPLLTKAIQEQQEEINELKQEVKRLSGNTVLSKSEAAAQTVNLTDAALGQNTPNPFINSTGITYNIPAGYKSAQLVITDANGTTVKQMPLNATGKGVVNINAANLSSGTYNYSLLVDGKLVGTRQMVLAK